MTGLKSLATAAVLVSMVLAGGPRVVDANHGPSINHEVTAQQSLSGGVSPDSNGNTYTYQYTVQDGATIQDTLPVQFCLTSITEPDPDRPWVSVTYSFGAPSGDLSTVQVPSDVIFTKAADGDTPPPPSICKTANISINTGPLTLANPNVAENRASNVNIGVDGAPGPPHGLSLNPTNAPNVHIQVTILPAEASTSCYLTDSSGLFLADCVGQPITESGSDGGRFAIVTNRKGIGVATNPGQFYYNVIWLNSTGSDKTVNVQFDRDGVNPKGAQAIHAAVFEPVFGGVTPGNFEIVNDAIPGGANDVIQGIVVPAGWTLWVNYHLEWSGLGSVVPPDCTSDCLSANPDGVSISVGATITGEGVSEECEAGAWGYRKP